MDALDRRIINELQGGFPVCEYPFREMAQRLGSTESELITRLGCMLEDGLLTRFGPMFHAEHLGGGLSLSWTKISGPGVVSFAPANAASTTVGVSLAGSYVLQLQADDGAEEEHRLIDAPVDEGQ